MAHPRISRLARTARNLLLAAGLLVPLAGFPEDIDLFKGGTAITGQKPNVLIIVDNTVNWNSNANHWPGGKQAQEELRRCPRWPGRSQAMCASG